MDNSQQATAIGKYSKGNNVGPSGTGSHNKGISTTSTTTTKKIPTSWKGAGSTNNSNFRIRPERAKRLSSGMLAACSSQQQQEDGEASSSKVLTMSAMLNQIKKKQ